jgi:cytoskeleton protein RodZ
MAFVCEAMIHSELGDQLRRARENKHWSLEEAERATGIRKRFLQAMEEGRWEALPGELQVRGFLRSYSNHLGLNGEDMLALHEHRVQSAQTATTLQSASPERPMTVRPAPLQSVKPKLPVSQSTRPATPTATQTQPAPQSAAPPVIAPSALSKPSAPSTATTTQAILSRLPSWLTLEVGLIIIAVILVLCVIVLLVSLLTSPTPSAAPAPRSTATRLIRAVEPSPTILSPTATALPVSNNITSSVHPISTTGYVQVSLSATEHVWVRVKTDGQTAFEKMLDPGQTLKWEAKELVVVETGNGAGLTASANGTPVGVLGQRGQLVSRAWTPDGETTPPQPTPLPSTSTPTP